MLKQISQVATLPVSLDQVKAQTNIEDTLNDDYLTELIEGATDLVEKESNVDLRSTTWDLLLPKFSNCVVIPRAPLVSVSSVKYYDLDNTLQTLDSSEYYVMNAHGTLGWITIHDYRSFSTYRRPDAVQIRFISGYETAPPIAVRAICLIAAHWNENREAVITGTIATELPLAYQRLVNQLTVGV